MGRWNTDAVKSVAQATKNNPAPAASERVSFRLLPMQPEELAVLEPRERRSLIEWMESKYMLKGGTAAIEGLWSREYTPYLVPVAEWFNDMTTREIHVFACSQAAKTTFGTGAIGWITEESPGPTMLIMPTKDDVRNRVEARIRPMFAANEELLSHVRGQRVTNIFIGKQTVMDHMILYIGWPTTAEALADKPVCYIIADELGKYPPFVGAEADPMSLMRKRQRWFKTRSKLLAMTTPVTENDMSDQEWSRGDRCEWWVPCPHCDKWHQLWDPADTKNPWIARTQKDEFYPENRYKSGKLSHYFCPKCKRPWTEDDRWRAVGAGKPVPGDCKLDDNGHIIGDAPPPTSYHSCRIHAMMLHPMVETVTSLVCEFVHAIKARSMGNIQPYKDFWNSQRARPWREQKAVTDIDKLRKHIGSYPKDRVPPGVQMLTQGLDVQLDHVYSRVIGWGYLGEQWSITEERIETGATDRVENLEKLLPYLVRQFPLMENEDQHMRISLSAIDRSFNTETVDAFCVRCLGAAPIVPVAGDETVKKQQMRKGQAAGGRIQRFDLNVTAFKDALYRRYFESLAAGPGHGHLHKDTPFVVLEHLTSEEKKIKRKGDRITWIGWVPKAGVRRTDYWDCDVYASAAAELAGLWALASPAQQQKEIPPAGKPVGERPMHTKY